MASVKMFRDRAVSLEQTQEIGEKHLELLTELIQEALPGSQLVEHGLEHEPDLFYLDIRDAAGVARRVSFTRMFLSDAARLPAIASRLDPMMRDRVLECIRRQASRPQIAVALRALLTDDEQAEADEIEGEWRKKEEALAAARRAEEERRNRERRRVRQLEEQRRAEERRRKRPQQPEGAQATQGGPRPQQQREGRRRHAPQGRPPQAAEGAAPQRPPQQRHPQQQRRPAPSPGAATMRAPGGAGGAADAAGMKAPGGAGGAAEAASPAEARPPGEPRAGGKRKRRRGRGRGPGGPRPGSPPGAASPGDGGAAPS